MNLKITLFQEGGQRFGVVDRSPSHNSIIWQVKNRCGGKPDNAFSSAFL